MPSHSDTASIAMLWLNREKKMGVIDRGQQTHENETVLYDDDVNNNY